MCENIVWIWLGCVYFEIFLFMSCDIKSCYNRDFSYWFIELFIVDVWMVECVGCVWMLGFFWIYEFMIVGY